ncbi:hypothetical protein ACJMK2_034924 [Sinanodonta woodiana]|uniref:G-protein coupled receptors family 1 profile domain-containing protein n=1 Tax=Sinanodonta woodiana TaxID=1069815 RepID=A0ABD3WX32_SINWO
MTAILEDSNFTNYSIDYPNINLTSELSKFLEQFEEKPTVAEITLKILFYVISMCGAFFGNLIVLLVIACHRVLRTKFNFYIINLVTADLLMPVFCMWVHLVSSLKKQWPLGETFCRIHTFLQVMLVCVNIFTLAIATTDRFLAAFAPGRLYITQTYQWVVVTFIWIIASCISLPWILYQKYTEFDWLGEHQMLCDAKFPSEASRIAYTLTFFLIMYIIPIFVMFLFIILTLYIQGRTPSPTSIPEVTQAEEMQKRRPRGIKEFKYIALYLAYSSSALNPIVYIVYNKCFRNAVIQMWKRKCSRHRSNMSVSPGDRAMELYDRELESLESNSVTTISES